MGLRDMFRKNTNGQRSDQSPDRCQFSEEDKSLLRQAAANGKPCIVFIPYNGLLQSMSVPKPDGMHGYFVVRIDLLYADGSLGFAYKEEFMLWNASVALMGAQQQTGRTYFFVGFDWNSQVGGNCVNPVIFYQRNCCAIRLPLGPQHQFGSLSHAPGLPIAFFPHKQSITLPNGNSQMSAVNFAMLGIKYSSENANKPSTTVQTLEDWRHIELPTGGQELKDFMSHSVSTLLVSL